MSNGWTPERRVRQAALIVNWKPWEQSCGPKTERGKMASARNARRHGMRSRSVLEEARMLRQLIRQCRETAQEV
jgi:hypothetical protein